MASQVHSSSHSSPIDLDFDFNHGREATWLSAPSSPQRFGYFFLSTPSSPAQGCYEDDDTTPRSSRICKDSDVDNLTVTHKRKTPRSPLLNRRFGSFFLSAPPTPTRGCYQDYDGTIRLSRVLRDSDEDRLTNPKSPLLQTPQCKKKSSLWSTFSPKRKKKPSKYLEPKPVERGRVLTHSTSKASRREVRSLSPERRKWRLKDLLLFRSVSEGRGSNKDPFKKYSNKGTKSCVEGSSSGSTRGGGLVSPQELHYKANKALAEDFRKRSFLPYKQGILGPSAVNPTFHAI